MQIINTLYFEEMLNQPSKSVYKSIYSLHYIPICYLADCVILRKNGPNKFLTKLRAFHCKINVDTLLFKQKTLGKLRLTDAIL